MKVYQNAVSVNSLRSPPDPGVQDVIIRRCACAEGEYSDIAQERRTPVPLKDHTMEGLGEPTKLTILQIHTTAAYESNPRT